MSYTKEGFLEAFQLLNSGVNTKQANTYLLELETSPQVWNIAIKLLDQSTDQVKLYGATLINKKISQIKDLSYEQLLQFLLLKVNENSWNKPLINQLCGAISKLLVNNKQLMQQFVVSTQQSGNEEMQLRILKEIPVSICYHKQEILYQKSQTGLLLKKLVPLLIRSWDSSLQLVIEVIQNFSQFCRIDILCCNELLQRIMTLPIQKTQNILYDFMQNQKDDNNQIISKLSGYILHQVNNPNISSNRGYISLYIELCRYLINSPINLNDFKLILYNMLIFIQPKPDLIVDSMQFWVELTDKFHTQQRSQQQTLILCQALETLNQKIIQFSKFKKLLPHNYKTRTIELLDDQDAEDISNGLELGDKNVDDDENYARDFRQSAEDFFRLAYRIIKKFPQKLNSYFNQLYQLVTKGELQLQLVLFVLKSIVDDVNSPEQQKYISTIINMLVDHFDNLPQSILIPLTQLLYECDYIFTTNPQLTQKCLNVFLKMLHVKQISKLIAQTVQNIVETVCAQQSNTKPLLERFVSIIFQQINNIQDDVVRDSILGALIVLLTHQKNPQQSYRNFLIVLRGKIEDIDTKKQFQIMHSIIFVHDLKINASGLNQQFGRFIQNSEGLIVNLFKQIQDKNKKARLIHILTKITKKIGSNISSTLISLCNTFLSDSFISNININFCIEFVAAIIYFYNNDQLRYSNFLLTTLPNIASFVIGSQKVEILKSYVVLCHTLSEIGYAVDYNLIFEQLKRMMDLSFNYELFREILKYFIWLAKHNLVLQNLTLETVRHYNKLSDIYHQQLMSVFIEGFKVSGEGPMKNALSHVYPQLQPSNPIYQSLTQALRAADTKSIKNILLCLK